jgi:hypothetical protein
MDRRVLGLRDIVFTLVEQLAEHLDAAEIGHRYFYADDVLGGLVDGQVYHAPSAALSNPVLANFPFAFAADLQYSDRFVPRCRCFCAIKRAPFQAP